MSTVLRPRYRRFTLLGVAAALLLAGCGSGPSQAGAAAIVGDTVIPLNLVQDRLADYLDRRPEGGQVAGEGGAAPQAKLDKTARDILTFKIQHELTLRAAEREDVSVSEDTLSQLLEQAGGAQQLSEGTFFDADTFRNERARDQLLQVEIGRKYADKLAVTFDYFYANDTQDAIDKAKQIARDPAKMDQFVREAKQKDSQAGETDAKVSSAESPQLATTLLFGVPANTVIAFPPSPEQGNWIVAHVKERSTTAKPSADGGSQELTPDVLAGIGLRMLQPLSDELKIRVNPRYGVWDNSAMGLAPSEGEKAGFQIAVQQPKS
ncbi:SurA N-terminal domain-containing protein [Umezawaea sp. Da 62-37]|uniref:SurA N-terminal domain-containing protein n=1 Tax=Umezawaea sp. Da 62-37 TaxID=3075927 RepID=UPI0028F6D003|nr:SurA N-terminal domain-containing protein [Umezawaea sp. Da 62-37]WNV82278.1 SurA N-terminal domain-containing protein [Umezawaea sp. Da 62-37]